MQLSNEIVLRPRFQIQLEMPASEVAQRFKDKKRQQSDFGISCLDDHIFVKLPRKEQLLWSPQLHLEIISESEDECTLKGFFGPNPTVWTMFIFFHVVVATLFIANLIWLYSNLTLERPTLLQYIFGVGLIIAWILLYTLGTVGIRKGRPGMRELYRFMLETIT